MALTGPDFWSPERGDVMPTAVGQRCFLCEEGIRCEPAWTWHGASGAIYLHVPGCAADFAVRLFADLLAFQRGTGHRFREGNGS